MFAAMGQVDLALRIHGNTQPVPRSSLRRPVGWNPGSPRTRASERPVPLSLVRLLRRPTTRKRVRTRRYSLAGGAKTLASPCHDFERDFILEQARMSILLHRTERAFLMSHSDCAT